MRDPDSEMLAYVRLAEVAQARGQWLPRNKFLVLAGGAACRAGWLDVAARCRELVLQQAPHHLLRRFETFPEALRDAEFQAYWKQLAKFCPYERAEHLLQQIGPESGSRQSSAAQSAGELALERLQGPRAQ